MNDRPECNVDNDGRLWLWRTSMQTLAKAAVVGLGLLAGGAVTAHAQYYNYYGAPNTYSWSPNIYSWSPYNYPGYQTTYSGTPYYYYYPGYGYAYNYPTYNYYAGSPYAAPQESCSPPYSCFLPSPSP